MSDLHLSQYTKLVGGADFQALANQSSMHVFLWDIGPGKPVAPVKPEVPKGKEGDPDYELAKIDFKEAIDEYSVALKAYKLAKAEYAEWQEKQGGAVEIMRFSCDAADALARAPERYFLSSSTRGHEKLKNRGLPPGHKPGHGHEENIRRAQQGDDEFAAARAADPVFGNPELRP